MQIFNVFVLLSCWPRGSLNFYSMGSWAYLEYMQLMKNFLLLRGRLSTSVYCLV